MPLVARALAVISLLTVISLCVFGFMATFEPMDPAGQIMWRVIYGSLGGICAAVAVRLLLPRRAGA